MCCCHGDSLGLRRGARFGSFQSKRGQTPFLRSLLRKLGAFVLVASIGLNSVAADTDIQIDPFNFPTSITEMGDVHYTGPPLVTATDALTVLNAAVGNRDKTPAMDVNGSADEFGNHTVTATDALTTLKIAVGLSLPGDVLDIQEFRAEALNWTFHQQSLNTFGLIEITVEGRRVARTKNQGEMGLAMLEVYEEMDQGLLLERDFTKEELVDAILKIHAFYINLYEQDIADGTFDGFAEYYDVLTGEPVYDIGEGGHLTEDTAYIMGFIAQEIGIIPVEVILGTWSDPLDMVFVLIRWIETPELKRLDGGVRLGINYRESTPQAFSIARTSSNLVIRDMLIKVVILLDTLSLEEQEQLRLLDQIYAMSDFLETVLWDDQEHIFFSGVNDRGRKFAKPFLENIALAGLSQVPLPKGYDRQAFLDNAEAVYRGTHPWDNDPRVSIDGYGTLKDNGVQVPLTLKMAFAYNMLDSRPWTVQTDSSNIWKWFYLMYQVAQARIDIPGIGSGLADATTAHADGYGSIWDTQDISPSAIAWWILTTLDSNPFIIDTYAWDNGLLFKNMAIGNTWLDAHDVSQEPVEDSPFPRGTQDLSFILGG